MIDYATALERLLSGAAPGASESMAPMAALGRVLVAPLVAREALPPFDNSAMDGFALACGDATVVAGTELDIHGATAAGDARASSTAGAWEIMTGAPVPHGLDAIVPVEQAEAIVVASEGRARRIRLAADVSAGQHVRRSGEDVAVGDCLAAPGTLIDPALATLCAAVGIDAVPVRMRPRVAVFNTGRELIDDPAHALADGGIRNSNGPFLEMRLVAAGADVVARRTLGDDVDDFLAALSSTDADVVVSTGAVSMGRFDFVPEALARLGATTLFHKVRIRPGKPVLVARLPSGGMFFGLPGNPASTAVGVRFFVEPLLRAMLGLPAERFMRLPLRAPFAKRAPLRMHLKARIALDASGHAGVEILGGQESFRLRPLLQANAWAVVDADVDALPAGALVDVATRGHLEPLEIRA